MEIDELITEESLSSKAAKTEAETEINADSSEDNETEVVVEEDNAVSGVDTETLAMLEKIYSSTQVNNSISVVQGVFICFLCSFFLARLVYSKFLRN